MLENSFNPKITIFNQLHCPYTTPSTVKEVSAIFVATIIRLQFGGGGLNTRTCTIIKHMHEFQQQ